MKNNVLKFGIIAGAINAIFILIASFLMDGDTAFKNAELLGYTGMAIAFSMIVIGMIMERQARGGIINYVPTLMVGLKIALIASAIYVTTWMIITAIKPEIIEGMFKMMEENLRSKELPATDFKDQLEQMNTWRTYYANPLTKIVMTFIEIFPLGAIISAIAAIFIFRKSPVTAPEA
ncbi:MAG: hypothetical protein ACI9JN_001945 [Bacteroidia bacterium]|jgi:hypothetical protein